LTAHAIANAIPVAWRFSVPRAEPTNPHERRAAHEREHVGDEDGARR
jgi:hypothetical protein